jgi:TolB-like protein/Tfp pilus assembly protein PilF
MHAGIAAAAGQLGDHETASKAVRDLLKLQPDFSATAQTSFAKWFDADLRENLIDGLRKAGLEIAVEEEGPPHLSSEKRADEGFWIAVLPFKFTGSERLEALAEGLSAEIVTGLSRFSYIRVIASSSTLRYVDKMSDVRTTGRELGARYVMSGSLRQAGSILRVSVQIIDSTNEAHLWAETYERTFSPETIFAVQDDLVPRIVSSVADPHGVLPYAISELLRTKGPDELSPYEAVMRSFGYGYRFSPEEHAAVTNALQRAVQRAPDYPDAWAMLALTYVEAYASGFNEQPDTLERALKAAQRAVETGAANAIAYNALAKTRFFQKEFDAFRIAAERAIELNPLNGPTIASLGGMIAYAGEWDRGCALVERAAQFHKRHPGWYWFPLFYNSYRLGQYGDALSITLKINLPLFFSTHVVTAAACGQLGNREGAEKALKELLSLKPDFATTARENLGKWIDPELAEHVIEGLCKAGLQIASRSSSATIGPELTSAPSSSSFINRPSIVVLPFVNRSPDPDNEYFSDGLTEEIISDLSIIKALRVISRNSSMTFKGTLKDTLSISKELGVSHIVSGSVRKAGDDLRITVELVEVAGDTPLWSDKYSGTLDNVFGFQEEISRKIVSALQLRLTEAETQIIAERPIDNAAAYDCYMRARHEIYLFTAEGLDRAQKLVDSGLSLIGENPLLLATRGMVSWYYLNFSMRPEAQYLDEAAAYATKALEQDPQNTFGIFLRGLVAAKRGDIESTLRDLRNAHEQRPGDSMILNELIRHLTSAGQELDEPARRAFEESLRLDPLHPLNWAQAAWRHFSAGRLEESMLAARRIFRLTALGNPARVYGAYYLALTNMREEAINIFDAEGAALAGTAYGSMSLFLSRALQRDAEGAAKHVTPQLEQAATWTEYLALFLADGYSLLGDNDAAIRWLHTARAQGFINYPYLATRDPFLVNVRSDPRFEELMREVKKRWEALTLGLPAPAQARVDSGQHITTNAGVGHSPSIAVLPFVNISNDSDNEYFCDGLAEELLNALSKVESLRVAARTSAFSFKGKETDIRDIGAKLSVSTVLEGSVRKSGNHVRISAQLVNVTDGYHLWSEKYDRQLEDIFDIQDEISLAIVDALKVKLLRTEQKVVTRYTDNTEAYQLYLKGRFFVNQRTSQSLLKAIDYFNQAIELDADYALGYAGLADAYMVLGVPDAVTEALSPLESLTKARAAAEKALQIDASVGEVYAALAHIKWKERDWAGAEHDYKRSIELKPQNPIAHFYYAVCLAGLGRCDEAVTEIKRAQELDPLSLPVNASVVYVLYLCRQYDEAIRAGQKTLELDPGFALTHQRLGLPYVQKKMYSEAITEFQQAVTNSNRAPQPLISLAHAYAVSGNKVEALKVLAELKALSLGRYVSPYGIAMVYLGLSDNEQALNWLERAYDEQNTELTFLKVEPRLDPLRDDLRFQKLLKQVGFPE